MTFPLTTAQIAANQAENNFSAAANQDLNTYRQRYKQIFKQVVTTQTSQGAIPTEAISSTDIITALQENAAPMLAILSSHYTYLTSIKANLQPTDVIPAYTVNSDNTVTLTPSVTPSDTPSDQINS